MDCINQIIILEVKYNEIKKHEKSNENSGAKNPFLFPKNNSIFK